VRRLVVAVFVAGLLVGSVLVVAFRFVVNWVFDSPADRAFDAAADCVFDVAVDGVFSAAAAAAAGDACGTGAGRAGPRFIRSVSALCIAAAHSRTVFK
jgi:hypothetical protein